MDDSAPAPETATIGRLIRRNFRLREQLIPKISRGEKLNQLGSITEDFIEQRIAPEDQH
ncbi:hypothetical protein [Glutamicibacter arilaitensis]|uniref:hypothetical protein n=1 Tax=Glutamicibacter arilaitensis TaxID=256701 RepID=UPI00384CADB7